MFRRDLALFADRGFGLLFTARTVSMFGMSFAPVAVAFGVLDIPRATAGTLSWVLAAQMVPLVLLLLFGGVLADRFPRNRVMMVGEVLSASGFGALAVMMLSGWTPLAAMMSAAALDGIGQAVLFPALTGIIPQVVPPDSLQAGNGLLGLGANVARISGVVVSGAVVAWLGSGWSLVVCALMFAVPATLLSRLTLRPTGQMVQSNSVLTQLRHGWTEFRSRQWLWVVVAQFALVVMALQAAHGVLGPVVAKAELGGPRAWSLVLAGEALGMIAGVLVAIRIRPTRPILLGTMLTAVSALPYFLLGLSAPLWAVVLAAVAMGMAMDVFGVLWQTTMQREVPADALSRVSSYDAFGSLMFGPIGLLLAGPATVLIGAHTALIGCAVIVLIATAAALCAPQVRQLRAPSTPNLTTAS